MDDDENDSFDPKANVTATDSEDGDLTSKIEVIENTVNNKVAGVYKVTYKVTDSANQIVTKTIKVIVFHLNQSAVDMLKIILKGWKNLRIK